MPKGATFSRRSPDLLWIGGFTAGVGRTASTTTPMGVAAVWRNPELDCVVHSSGASRGMSTWNLVWGTNIDIGFSTDNKSKNSGRTLGMPERD
ncbi:hypothetical protein KC19_VG325000 [Ceratodon purpureus]|uniref:Uncharacterized protein n=1 Tax=Ceratodon purpureus TaxID=3225 RepID=A0A8T0HWF5_CERPU|nr:hypothetical protein KC19_VG325000 [Ceratodon purpureus]